MVTHNWKSLMKTYEEQFESVGQYSQTNNLFLRCNFGRWQQILCLYQD